MRKRSVNHIADTIFWYVVYMFPIILTIVQTFSLPHIGNLDGFDGFFELLAVNLRTLGCNSNGIIVSTLSDIFGEGGILPLFNNGIIFGYAQWFVGTLIVHLAVDVLLFLPRIAHKWLDDFSKKER